MPVHSAQPAPPFVHWLPRAGGEKPTRPLPPHSSTMRKVFVLSLKRDLSSPTVNSSFLLTSPSMANFHASPSFDSVGIWPLLRTKNFAVGVVSSSSRCSGVSATSGRSPSTTRPSSLPGNFKNCGPFGAAEGGAADAGAAVGGAAGLSWARAAGKSPAGMLAANGMAPPTAAPMAASPAPLSNPRRPNTTASARSGSSL